MTSKKRLLAVVLAGAMLLSSVTAASAVRSPTANDSLTVLIEDVGNDGAMVTVTGNGSAVENASVTVETTTNTSYAGAGEYVTDENGTVSLPEPETNVTVEVTAAKDNATGETTATLSATEESDETDETDESQSFGRLVSAFVHQMLNADSGGGPFGEAVSEFATSNNPGSEHGSDDAGKPDDAGKSDQQGKPADAGPRDNSSAENRTDDDSQGPPDYAGPGGESDPDDEEGERGPPDHAGPGNDADEETTTTTEDESE